jgi:hypothetical protein
MSEEMNAPEVTAVVTADKIKQDIAKELGIDLGTLDAWKKNFGKIEADKIGGRWFVYRSLKRSELKQIRQGMQGGDDMIQEEKIASRCLVHPKLSELELRDDDAGLATTLCELIYHFSGYSPEAPPVRL